MALPLEGVRVVDLTQGAAQYCGRYLADLGAEVILVEPPGGSPDRRERPVHQGVSLPFALRNANKLGVALDLEDAAGRRALLELAASADIVLDSAAPGRPLAPDLDPQALLAHNPALVVVSITGFGRSGPYRDWTATEDVLYALGGVLSRSGLPGAEPLLPPSGLIDGTVAAYAAWAALVAYAKRLRTGEGEQVDVSAFEAVVHAFDPGFGTQGTAAAARPDTFPRGRQDARNFYPVFRCADGYVRLCLLAKRQWRAMFTWLGEPEEFADPKYDTIPARYKAADRLHPLIAKLFADRTREELVAEGMRRGIPLAGVLSPAEALSAEHFAATGTFVDAEIAPGLRARIPTGTVQVDGVRAGFRHRAPEPGEHNDQVLAAAAQNRAPAASQGGWCPPADGRGPLDGLRVLDLGVIVFGAELSRLFADQGADVIKIENSAFPDGLRQSRRGAAMSASFAWGHRNKRGLGLDLRSPEGTRIFRELVAQADVVLANFKPGTLESLGLSYADLAEINPRIVLSDSSAFGGAGPWSGRMGYGPLVRASCGVSALWRYPDGEDAFCDGSTVYPDHVAAHVTAIAVLAGLIARLRTGRGMPVVTAQADTAITQLGEHFVAESLAPGSVAATGNRRPHQLLSGVFRCAGDDEWCVISVRDEAEWARMCEVIGHPSDDRRTVEEALARWTAARPPREVMETLQNAGVPAGAMLRLPDQLTDPQLTARDAFATLEHDLLPGPLAANNGVARFSTIPDPPQRPAPLPGEHTRQICSTVLEMSPDRIDELLGSGVLQSTEDAPAG